MKVLGINFFETQCSIMTVIGKNRTKKLTMVFNYIAQDRSL